jgi:ABC-type molybdate transport system ATPase subunit
MKTKKEKQCVVNKLRRGLVVADVYVSYDTREVKRVSTPEDFMRLATGRVVDRLSWTDGQMWVCLD